MQKTAKQTGQPNIWTWVYYNFKSCYSNWTESRSRPKFFSRVFLFTTNVKIFWQTKSTKSQVIEYISLHICLENERRMLNFMVKDPKWSKRRMLKFIVKEPKILGEIKLQANKKFALCVSESYDKVIPNNQFRNVDEHVSF